MLRIVAALAALSAASASGLVATVRMEPVVDSPCVDNVKQYAGYVDVSDKWDSHYFAWLSESRSNPSTDPLIVWLSGGPGCSSSLAMLTENGPCTAKADGSGTTRNPYGWNTKANLMYVDHPAGVGFSYADRGGYSHNESQVGEYMVAFFTGFYKKYPQYANNPLYMACESYGGHYCPSATYALFESNKNAGTNFPIKGMAIGNGLVDPASQYPTYPKFVEDEGTNMNPYDIRIPCEVPPLCYDFSGVATFLNNPATQKAIRVNGITWASCNYEVNGDFSADWMKNMAWKVPPLLKAGIPAWVYAGEDDFIVQWLGNQAWTEALPWPGAKAYNQTTLQPWTSGGKVAGAHRSYGGLSFTTVANAGHMAPP